MASNWNGQAGSSDDPITIDIDEDENGAMQVDPSDNSLFAMEAEESEEIPSTQDEDEIENFAAASDGLGRSPRKSDSELDRKLEKMLQNEAEQQAKLKTFRTFSESEKLFPDVRVSGFQSVLFHLSPADFPKANGSFTPQTSREFKWDSDHVPMPFDREFQTTVKVPSDREAGSFVRERVPIWDLVRKSLQDRTFHSFQDIEDSIRCYFRSLPTLNVLKYTIEELMTEADRTNFLSKILPEMVKYCLQLPDLIACPLPLLRRSRNYSITMHQIQVASLLANAFFSTFPDRIPKDSLYPSINFFGLFSCDPEHAKFETRAQKIRCLLHYFERIVENVPTGVVTYTRKSLKPNSVPAWDMSDKKIRNLAVLCEGTIEDTGKGMLQVDFANRYIGGGVMGGGAVQEEILFVMYPELLISRLFTENMGGTEAVVITGCERFCKYKGYASGFKYDGDYVDTTSHDEKRRRRTQFIAIDALYLARNPSSQYHPRNMLRELNKAYVGFYAPVKPPSAAIASGKWGCGAFRGDPELKGILQLLAASEADKDLVFFTFGDMNLQQTLIDMFDCIKDRKIGEVWNFLRQYYKVKCAAGNPTSSVSEFCQEYFNSVATADQGNTQDANGPNCMSGLSKTRFFPIDPVASTSATSGTIQKEIPPSTAPAPGSSATTPILSNVESSKKFNSWLSNLESVKSDMRKGNKKNTSVEMYSPFEAENDKHNPAGGDSKLTEDQIAKMVNTDEETRGSKPKRQNMEKESGHFGQSGSPRTLSPRSLKQARLPDFYKD